MLYIYPGNDEIYGHATWLYSIAYLFLPLASGGFLSLIVKYFPSYSKDDPNKLNGFLSLVLGGLGVSFLVFIFLWFAFRDAIVRLMKAIHIPNTELIIEYQFPILLLVGCIVLLKFLTFQSWNSLRTVVPDIIEKLGYKLYLPLLVLVFAYSEMGVRYFSYSLIGFFAIACIFMVVYLKFLGKLNFGEIKKPQDFQGYGEMAKYGLFGSMNLIGSNLATKLDTIMIPLFLDMMRNGFYAKSSFIANVLDYPTRALSQIAAPIISKAWQENDMKEISMIYKKSSANLFLLGGLMFVLIWFGLDDVIALSKDPSTFPQARMIFILLATSKLVDMLTSVNTQILVYSKDYKYSLLFLLALGLANIVLNVKLIPEHGIVGAAMATAISLFAFNILKLIFIYFRFSLHPFSMANIKTLVLMVLFLSLYFVLPSTGSPFVNLIYKSAIVGLGYLSLAYFWKISEDANELGLNLLKRIF